MMKILMTILKLTRKIMKYSILIGRSKIREMNQSRFRAKIQVKKVFTKYVTMRKTIMKITRTIVKNRKLFLTRILKKNMKIIQSIVLFRFKMILTILKATIAKATTIILLLKSLNPKDLIFIKKVNMKTNMRRTKKTKIMKTVMKNSVILQCGSEIEQRHHQEEFLRVLMKLFASIQIRKLYNTA